jgi:regulator of protease activity HflC (stomatin/prohibitin superfamily)
MEMIIDITLITVAAYLLSGLVFAIAFLAKGLTIVDEGAHGSSIGFRIVIIPGVIVFWPFLLYKWRKAKKERYIKRVNE